ncbi:Hypothetical protein ORPV_358 [Orpheovirus IHUMI-LCC2]|uniref:Uncharacterized protein n=1 Tax=Orpheovirus IHUMI-LCC2 TaxID=2023057 RepID=A0A2I2L3Y7_9VIRU|nr:Hypothetical protein ORPV_358 [Orpheovirus IHUMI-LCC2]SNW62262.1 Hypothetical protein ORPV_358 [Orpheovirus IHUMI-LCC2]
MKSSVYIVKHVNHSIINDTITYKIQHERMMKQAARDLGYNDGVISFVNKDIKREYGGYDFYYNVFILQYVLPINLDVVSELIARKIDGYVVAIENNGIINGQYDVRSEMYIAPPIMADFDGDDIEDNNDDESDDEMVSHDDIFKRFFYKGLNNK